MQTVQNGRQPPRADHLLALDPTKIVPASNVVAWYPLDEEGISTRVDVQNARNLQVQGTNVWHGPGIAGRRCLSLTGLGGFLDLITAGHNAAFALTDGSWIFYAKPTTTGAYHIAGHHTTTVSSSADRHGWVFRRVSEATGAGMGGILFQYYDTDGNQKNAYDKMHLPIGAWSLVQISREFVSGGPHNKIIASINGIVTLETAIEVSGVIPDPGVNSVFTIGAKPDGSSDALIQLQDFIVLDTPITAAQMATEARRVGILR